MPIGGGFKMKRLPSSSTTSHEPTSTGSLDKPDTDFLRQSLMQLQPIVGTIAPSEWTTASETASHVISHKASSVTTPERQSSSATGEKEQPAEPATFAMLPENVLEHIFHELPLKCDQRALTLVSHKAYTLLVKDLYKTIVVDISTFPRCLIPFTQMLDEQNPGRRHIRGVVFDQTDLVDKLNPPAGFDQLAYYFLAGLEFEQLRYFGWPADYQLKPEYSLMLWQIHPCLENIELYERSWERSVDAKNALSQMKNVNSLRLSPDSEAGLKNVDKIISNIDTISYLHVDLRSFCNPESKDATFVPQKLFSKVMAASLKRSPKIQWKMSLLHLNLWCVDLDSAACAEWVRVLDLHLLQSIQLSHCPGVENFLAAMASDTRKPELLSLTINHQAPSAAAGHAICDALEEYLEKDSALSNLILRLENLPRAPNWMHVAVHGLQLETLLLDIGGSNPYSANDIENILGCASDRLRQLGFVAPPDMKINIVFDNCNPATLYLLGTNHHEVREIFDGADEGHKKGVFKDDPFRLRVVALNQDGRAVCFMRGELTILRRKRRLAFNVPLQDLTKSKEEVDILVGEPVMFGLAGRL